MFKLAVLGPIVTGGFGVARHCVTCYHAQPSSGGLPCFGFNAGCIGYRPKARERISDRAAREAGTPSSGED